MSPFAPRPSVLRSRASTLRSRAEPRASTAPPKSEPTVVPPEGWQRLSEPPAEARERGERREEDERAMRELSPDERLSGWLHTGLGLEVG